MATPGKAKKAGRKTLPVPIPGRLHPGRLPIPRDILVQKCRCMMVSCRQTRPDLQEAVTTGVQAVIASQAATSEEAVAIFFQALQGYQKQAYITAVWQDALAYGSGFSPREIQHYTEVKEEAASLKPCHGYVKEEAASEDGTER